MKEIAMKILFITSTLMLCLMFATACFQSNAQQHQLKSREARNGLDPVVSQVRQFQDFDVVTVKYYDVYDDEHGQGAVCYYARAYLLIGTSLSLPEALDVYAQHLQSLGWTLEGRQYETAKGLVRGVNERAVVESGEPGPELQNAADLDQLRKTYRNLIFLNIDYVLPAVTGC
jgi:hypothetical protein